MDEHTREQGFDGYLCLGLSYKWDNEQKVLVLKEFVLVRVDRSSRCCTEMNLYNDRFRYPADNVVEKDGVHFYHDVPILNYNMLDIPQKLHIANEGTTSCENGKVFPDTKGDLKYSVNRMCNIYNEIVDDLCSNIYTELYACVLDFDEELLQGYIVGFDYFGKIMRRHFNLKGMTDPVDIHKELLKDMVIFGFKPDRERYEREEESGFLNFDISTEMDGNVIYKYNSIW